MPWLRRLPYVVVLAGLAGLLVAACSDDPMGGSPFQSFFVKMTVTGLGQLQATDPDDGNLTSCTSSSTSPCGFAFVDAGLGGSITVTAVPDAGATLQSWTTGCPGTTSLVCVVSFSTADDTISAGASFVGAGIVFQDAFEGGCGQWSASRSGTAPGSSSEACPGTGGSDGGAYREMTHVLSDLGNRAVVHTYTPGSVLVGRGGGAETCVATVRFQEQRIITSSTNAAAAVGAAVWIEQNGVRYNGPSSTFTDIAWTGYDSDALTAADFTAGLDLCPATASTLTFGYIRSNTNTAVGNVVNVHGIDQWSVTFVPAP